MQEIYASLLLHSAKMPITEENLSKVLQSVGASVDQGKLKALTASLEGQNIDELLQQATVVVAPKAEEKKEEKKEDEGKAAESASAGLSSLFG